ncbi:sulfurtransferase TusA family protein [Salinicola aestuarinus]|uniref:sulfurtransferase TusA family protein n=1 Tax=Salinicola aestuarinus TaxID=1949082 RepID=UPI000DA118B0|nr:sulfurtransferase TusA family protein [Salinicola aestuarinus]
MSYAPDERSHPSASSPINAGEPDARLDATGLDCPLPLLKAKQALASLPDGGVLEVIATDPGSWRDFESFAAHSRHELLERTDEAGRYRYRLLKVANEERS